MPTIYMSRRELGNLQNRIRSAVKGDAIKGSGESVVSQTVGNKIGRSLGTVLRDQALERIRQSKDFEPLWVTTNQMTQAHRYGGKPLWDSGNLMTHLHSRTGILENGIVLQLLDGTRDGYGLKHQEGYTTIDPTFIPITKKAIDEGKPSSNLKEGFDYVIAPYGVTVPARKIFDVSVENRKDIGQRIVDAVLAMR